MRRPPTGRTLLSTSRRARSPCCRAAPQEALVEAPESAAGAPAETRKAAIEPAAETPAESDAVAAAEQGEPLVRGRCVDKWGTPLEGVELACAVQLPEGPEAGMTMMGFARAKKAKRGTSDEDGRFEVEPASLEHALELSARSAGYIENVRELGRPARWPLELTDIVLEPGAIIRGVVTDERGDPLRAVSVEIEYELDTKPKSDLERMGIKLGAGPRTKADGRFEFLYARSGQYVLTASHKKRPARRIEGSAQVGDELELTVELPDGGRIAGRVVGLPDDARGVIVQARRSKRTAEEELPEGAVEPEDGMFDAIFDEMGMATSEYWTKIDHEGNFELAGLEVRGAYVLWLAAPTASSSCARPAVRNARPGSASAIWCWSTKTACDSTSRSSTPRTWHP